MPILSFIRLFFSVDCFIVTEAEHIDVFTHTHMLRNEILRHNSYQPWLKFNKLWI